MSREGIILSVIGAVTLVLVVGAALFLSGPGQTGTNGQGGGEAVSDTALLLGAQDNRRATGSPSAQVTIVEFADFQCPACASAYPVVKRIQEEYGDQIYYVFRHYPLPSHQNGRPAAVAAEAAAQQGKFWEMHDMLFEEQEAWSNVNNPKEIFADYAEQVGLDREAFVAAYEDGIGSEKIQTDVNEGMQLGVNSTPTFFINGVKYTGVLSYETFKDLLDQQLK